MITSIQMKDCLPYDSLGAEITDCKKVNFIYGANGSGKSTISEFLRIYEEKTKRYENSKIIWSTIENSLVMVYNREFRRNNFDQDAGIPGVFTLGEATIEEIKTLEELKQNLGNKRDLYNSKCDALRKKKEERNAREEQFKEDAWNHILKENEVVFQKAFEGFRNSKNRFLGELLRREKEGKGKVQKQEQLVLRAKSLYEKNPEKYITVSCSIESYIDSINKVRLDPIWSTVITGNSDVTIGRLINRLENSSWVRQGISYIEESTCVCPFCQKDTIDTTFRKELKQFFDSEFDEKIKEMEYLFSEFSTSAEKIVDTFISVSQAEKITEIGKLDQELFNARLNTLLGYFEKCKEDIKSKQIEPSKKVVIDDATGIIIQIQNMLEDANNNIISHNKLVEEIDEEMIKLTDDVWATCIDDASALIGTYHKDMKGISKAIENMDNACKDLKKTIDELNEEVINRGNNITSVQPTVNEINRTLKAYGFNNFSIVPAENMANRYRIIREDGTSAAQTLSEGEETFLTFLYFMQLTKGATDKRHISNRRIIVLDDPICSLDSTILYIVGSMVRELSMKIRRGENDVEQLFVLTHNVFFHKEASFIDGRTQEIGDVNYWIIRKDNGVSNIQSYGMKNPISTSYELLWKEIKDNKDISVISVQNTMRRIIENYFGMLGNRKDDYLVNLFDNLEERVICRSLLSWINDGSHSIPDDLHIDSYTDAVPRYKDVFRKLFVKSGNEAHYNMMMQVEEVE